MCSKAAKAHRRHHTTRLHVCLFSTHGAHSLDCGCSRLIKEEPAGAALPAAFTHIHTDTGLQCQAIKQHSTHRHAAKYKPTHVNPLLLLLCCLTSPQPNSSHPAGLSVPPGSGTPHKRQHAGRTINTVVHSSVVWGKGRGVFKHTNTVIYQINVLLPSRTAWQPDSGNPSHPSAGQPEALQRQLSVPGQPPLFLVLLCASW